MIQPQCIVALTLLTSSGAAKSRVVILCAHQSLSLMIYRNPAAGLEAAHDGGLPTVPC
jgi:hypothetical protein